MIYDFEKIFVKNMYIEIYIFIIDNDNMNKEWGSMIFFN